MTVSEQELPGMPPSAEPSEAALLERETSGYEQAVALHGPLIPPAVASRVLNVSPQAVSDLMKRRKLTRLEFYGAPWLPVAEVKARLTAPREAGGRPHNLNGGRPRKSA